MTHDTATKMLKANIAILVIAGGLLFAMASHPAIAVLPNIFIDLAFWPFDGSPRADVESARFLGAVGGGGFFGWGICLWCVVQWVLPKQPDDARKIILFGIFGWFLLDSTGSILAGAGFNVLMNVVILACFLIPLRALAR